MLVYPPRTGEWQRNEILRWNIDPTTKRNILREGAPFSLLAEVLTWPETMYHTKVSHAYLSCRVHGDRLAARSDLVEVANECIGSHTGKPVTLTV
jgi:hypothetical protein